jgi:hypothetical protein
MKVSFAIIGNNWGKRIYKILKEAGYSATILAIKNPLKYKKYNIYKHELNKILNKARVKYNIIWIAINPNKKILFDVVRECLERKFNLIIEKPWTVSKNKTIFLKRIQKKMKVLVGFHFQYLYLNFFKIIRKNKYLSRFHVKLEFYAKNNKLKNNHRIELGSHLIAIQKFFFPKNKNLIIKTGYKKNLRRVTIKNKNKKFIFNFDNNKEKIIQNFIKDYIISLKKKNKNFKLNFDFARMN